MNETDKKVLALGNFDGVHLGHKAVALSAVSHAKEMGITAAALTFEPHPRHIFSTSTEPFRLTSEADKKLLLREIGINEIITINFTKDIAAMPAKLFAEKMLAEELNAAHIVAGADFGFGQKRGGNMSSLREWLEPRGIDLTEIPLLMDEQGKPVSSSRIREALKKGNMDAASRLLGRNWSISGKVIHGQKRGKELGFPTANIDMGDYLRPKLGVYTIKAQKRGEKREFAGVANIGIRPTLNGHEELLEFHLFDFQGDIYEQDWNIELCHFIRPELTFPDLESLKNQIGKDVEHAKLLLSNPKTEI